METVFSHIVRRRLSREHENIATESLAYIVSYSNEARSGLMTLLRGVAPTLSALRFQTQQPDGDSRPDMWGYDGSEARVFIESKFWANLTERQPVAYLQKLASRGAPSVLLFVVPEQREVTLWRELSRRLEANRISTVAQPRTGDVAQWGITSLGPVLALTTWSRLISALERPCAEQEQAKSDLVQLRALCKAADTDVPISADDITDQRTPAMILQLSSIVQKVVDLAESRGLLHKGRTRPQADWERVGRYANFSDEHGVGFWIGIHFRLWRSEGGTPLWAVFSPSSWGCAREVRTILEPWAEAKGVRTCTTEGDGFAVALDIPSGQEKEQVIEQVTVRIREIEGALRPLAKKGPADGA